MDVIPAGYMGNDETDSATWPDLIGEPEKVSPHPLPRFATKVAPPAAAGPSAESAHHGPASRTRSRTRANEQAK